MITALRHGKLSRELEGMEDLLTSAVFSRLKYMSPMDALIPFLSYARYPNGEAALPWDSQVLHAKYEFWPWWQFGDSHGAEPDLVITLESAEGVRYKVLVEAKYRSGKSSEADAAAAVPADQLAREWDNLAKDCVLHDCLPLLIYLTADFACPTGDLLASEAEYRSKRAESEFPFRCAWLSWRHLGPALCRHTSPIAQDLVFLVQRLDLSFFYGIGVPKKPQFAWRYRQLRTPFTLEIPQLEKWAWTFRN